MAIPLNDNIKVNAPKPSEERYLNGIISYTSTAQADSATVGRRYIGLTVNINGDEYWYRDTINDGGLILKSLPSLNGITGSGTANYLPKFIGTTGIGNTNILLDASNNMYMPSNIGIGMLPTTDDLSVSGTVVFNGVVNSGVATINMPAITNAPDGGTPDAVVISVSGHNGTTASHVSGLGVLLHNNKSQGFYADGSGGATNSLGLQVVFDSNSTTNTAITVERGYNNVVFKVDDSGNTYSNSFIKSGGTSNQFLMADGSTSISATDINALHRTGNEDFTGTKTSTVNGSDIFQLHNNGNGSTIWSENNNVGNGIYIDNRSTGHGIEMTNYSTGQGIDVQNIGTGIGLNLNSNGNGKNIVSTNSGTYNNASFIQTPTAGNDSSAVYGELNSNTNSSTCFYGMINGSKGSVLKGYTENSTDDMIWLYNESTSSHGAMINIEERGNGIGIIIGTSLPYGTDDLFITHNVTTTANPFRYQLAGITKAVLNNAGEWTAQKFVKSGGTSAQFLKADGSIDSNIYLTSLTDTLQTVTNRGNTTNQPITANSFIKSGGTSAQILLADGNITTKTNLLSPFSYDLPTNTAWNAGTGNLSDNTTFGIGSMTAITTGNYNTAFGAYTLPVNTTGENNTAVGDGALYVNTTATDNTAIGASALMSNVTSSYNTAVGSGALQNSTSIAQGDNTAIGAYALYASTVGDSNTAIGTSAMAYSTTGKWNTAVGNSAMYFHNGSYNTALGMDALENRSNGTSTSGNYNIAIGFQAAQNLTTGANNLIIENNRTAGGMTTGSNNIILNPINISGVLTGNNNTIIGGFNNNLGDGSDRVIIGTGGGATRMSFDNAGQMTITSVPISGATTDKFLVRNTATGAIKQIDYSAVTSGAGDMTKLVYDTNLSGVVDNSERLGNQLPSYYQTALTNPVTGTGTFNTIPMWNGTSSLQDSYISYSPSNQTLVFSKSTNLGNNTASFGVGSTTNINFGGLYFTTDVGIVGNSTFAGLGRDSNHIVIKSANGGSPSRLDTSQLSTTRTFTFPDKSGTFALTSDLSGMGTGDMTKAVYDTNLNGIVDSAEKLATARTINGVAFDGTANITVYDSTKQPLLINPITGTGNSNFLPKFLTNSQLGNSLIYDTGYRIGVNRTTDDGVGFLQISGTTSIVNSGNNLTLVCTNSGANDNAHFINTTSAGNSSAAVYGEVNSSSLMNYCFQGGINGTRGRILMGFTSTSTDEMMTLFQGGTQTHAPVIRVGHSNGIGIQSETDYGYDSFYAYHGPDATGNAFRYQFNGTDLAWLNNAGEWTAQKFVKQGGQPTQYLMADGSTSTGNTGGTSAAYTPTYTNVANAGTINAKTSYYTKIGNLVTLYLNVQVFATTANTDTTVRFTFPFAKATTNLNTVNLTGTALLIGGTIVSTAGMSAVSTNDYSFRFRSDANANGNTSVSIICTYNVLD